MPHKSPASHLVCLDKIQSSGTMNGLRTGGMDGWKWLIIIIKIYSSLLFCPESLTTQTHSAQRRPYHNAEPRLVPVHTEMKESHFKNRHMSNNRKTLVSDTLMIKMLTAENILQYGSSYTIKCWEFVKIGSSHNLN